MNKGFKEFLFEDIVSKNKGFLRGPFGGSLKKEIFVPKGDNTYKVYEQGVVLRKNIEIGDYYIKEDYFNQTMYRFEVSPKDFLVSCSGANYGAIYQMPEGIEKGIINQALLRIRLNNKLIDDNYFDYFFSHHLVNQIIGKKGDSTIPNFPPVSVLKKLKIKIHSDVDYQKHIAKVLSDLDAKIEFNNKINQELEAMAKTLYDYWFVQFEFPTSEAQAERIGNLSLVGKPYKSSGGKMVFNEALKREIPEVWEVKELGDFSEIKRGKLVTAKTADLDGKYKVVSAGINYSYLHSESNRRKNTISVSGSGANAGFINFWREPIFANDCTTVRGKTDNLTLIILEFLKLRQEYIYKQARGSAQPHVYPKDISILKIAIPESDLFQRYGEMVIPGNDKIANNLKENQKLSELRDWLLPMLMNGQVSVASLRGTKQSHEANADNALGMVAEDNAKYDEV